MWRPLVCLSVLLAFAIVGSGPTKPSYASCSGYYSDVKPPDTIIILYNGQVQPPRDFKTYVKEVLAREWYAWWELDSLRAGAMAVRNYGWRNVNVSPGGPQCYDICATDFCQVWAPGYPDGFTPADIAKIGKAVDDIWAVGRMTRGQTVFLSEYKSGDVDDPSNPSDSYDSCGQYYYNLGLTASGWDASAQGTQSCALNGEVWTAIIRRYYFDNSTQPGHVMLLDDSPALTEYYYSGNVWGGHLFAVNGAGVVKYRTYTRITDSWAGWFSLPTPQGECSSAPSAMSQGASQLWIMCRNTNGGISARRWDGTSWGSWLDFGGVSISAPATAEFGTSLEVYLVGTGGDIQKRTCSIAQSSCSSVGNWTAWQPLVQPGAGPPGGCTSSPAADLRVSELYVFCRGAVASANPKAPAYYNRYTSSTGWSGWTTVP